MGLLLPGKASLGAQSGKILGWELFQHGKSAAERLACGISHPQFFQTVYAHQCAALGDFHLSGLQIGLQGGKAAVGGLLLAGDTVQRNQEPQKSAKAASRMKAARDTRTTRRFFMGMPPLFSFLL